MALLSDRPRNSVACGVSQHEEPARQNRKSHLNASVVLAFPLPHRFQSESLSPS